MGRVEAEARTIRVWIPVIVFEKEDGTLGYETHGAFDSMVSNREKRTNCEGDFWDCFTKGGETPDDAVMKSADLHWIGVDMPFQPQERRGRLEAVFEHGSKFSSVYPPDEE